VEEEAQEEAPRAPRHRRRRRRRRRHRRRRSANLIQTGLCWCEDISTFYALADNNDTLTAHGQCLPSTTPGAYYTKPGQKDATNPKNDKAWACWNAQTIGRTDADAKAHGYEGACKFKDYDSKATRGDAKDCIKYLSHHPKVCSPGPMAFWGACWTNTSTNWDCIPLGDSTIDGLAKGDCKARVVLETGTSTPTKHFFDGLCHFAPEKVIKYKCDTIPKYDKSKGGTCGQTVDTSTDKACFSLSGDGWQCYKPEQNMTSLCDWTTWSGSTDEDPFYTGECLFDRNPGYKNAIAWKPSTAAPEQVVV